MINFLIKEPNRLFISSITIYSDDYRISTSRATGAFNMLRTSIAHEHVLKSCIYKHSPNLKLIFSLRFE